MILHLNIYLWHSQLRTTFIMFKITLYLRILLHSFLLATAVVDGGEDKVPGVLGGPRAGADLAPRPRHGRQPVQRGRVARQERSSRGRRQRGRGQFLQAGNASCIMQHLPIALRVGAQCSTFIKGCSQGINSYLKWHFEGRGTILGGRHSLFSFSTFGRRLLLRHHPLEGLGDQLEYLRRGSTSVNKKLNTKRQNELFWRLC